MAENRRTPWLTLILTVACLAAAFAVLLQPETILDFGFRASSPSFVTVFTSLFLHENAFHLLGNLIFLVTAGSIVEFAVGRWKFGLLYLLGGAAGVMAHWAMVAGAYNPPPLIGASGAVAACFGYCSVRYMNVKVPIAPGKGVGIWVIGVVWAVLQSIGGVIKIGEMAGGTAFWAHLGGFIAGLLLSVILRAPKAASIEFGHEVLEQMNERGPAASLHAAEQHLKQHPEDIEVHRQRLEALRTMDDPEAEANALVETITSGPSELGADLVLRLQELDSLGDLPPALSARLAEEMKADHPEAAILLLESILKLPSDHPSRPDALLSLALLLEEHDEVRSGRLLKELSQSYGLHGAASVARAKGLIE